MTVRLSINGQKTGAEAGETLFECAERLAVRVPNSCRGRGKCRECLVEVEEGEECLTPRTEEEGHLGTGFRLSCRTQISATEGTLRCHTLRRGALRIDSAAEALEREREVDPVVAEGPTPRRGLAIDVGTTTVVVRLHDLESGALVATRAFENPQRFGGSDVMARIHYETEHQGRLLQRTLLGYLRHALADLPGGGEDVYAVTVVGNPTMRDLLFGLDVHSIGQRPYRSLTEEEWRAGTRTTTSLTRPARQLGLPVHAKAEIYGGPLIGSHVGADAAAAVFATDMAERDELALLMDIGTNTELVIGRRGRLLAASCPAGPAFEGGAIACGMPALEGAVEGVTLEDDGSIALRVVGEGEARGLCGSGLISLLGELLRTGRMNTQGRLDQAERFDLDDTGRLFLAERDISELAQAKGAQVAGLRIALAAYGSDWAEVERFYLAGGFARHLDLKAARRIGLLPDLPDECFVVVGNAGLEGASRILLSARQRAQLERLAPTIEHLELETHPDFFDFFVDGCQFEPFGREGT